MLCPNCKSTINIGDSFCKSCGFNVTGIERTIEEKTANNEINNNLNTSVNYQEQNIQNNINNSLNQQDSINFNDLMDAYIGKNVDKLKSGFSFCTFFFGVLYVFYRKMWLLGFIWILINLALSIFLPKLFLLQLVLNIVIAICFKKLYISHVVNKVTKIKEQYSNLSNQDLIYLCYKKGRTTIAPVIIVLAIYALMVLISAKIVLDEIDKIKGNSGLTNEDRYNVSESEINYIVSYFELAQAQATLKNSANLSKQNIREEFDVYGITWNNDDTITKNNNVICNVIVDNNNYIYLQCDVGDKQIVSKSVQLQQ